MSDYFVLALWWRDEMRRAMHERDAECIQAGCTDLYDALCAQAVNAETQAKHFGDKARQQAREAVAL